jgi:hypothetical protein
MANPNLTIFEGNVEVRYGIALTYRCNASCEWCNRYLDHVPWPDSDMKLENLKIGRERVRQCNVVIQKARVTGGEPLLHKEFQKAMRIVCDEWNNSNQGRTVVFSNGILPLPSPKGWRYRVSKDPVGERFNQTTMISPADVGLPFHYKSALMCFRQKGCGRLYDAFGFTFCIYALVGPPDICRHCVWSCGVKRAFKLFEAVHQGELEYPSKTYREGIARCKGEGPPKFKKFEERDA